LPAEPLNEPLNFITFIAGNQLGDEVEGTVGRVLLARGLPFRSVRRVAICRWRAWATSLRVSAREVLTQRRETDFRGPGFRRDEARDRARAPGLCAPLLEHRRLRPLMPRSIVAKPTARCRLSRATPARGLVPARRPAKVAGTAKQALSRDRGPYAPRKAAPTKTAAPPKTAAPIRRWAPTKMAVTKRPAKKAAASKGDGAERPNPGPRKPAPQRAATPAKKAGPASGSVVAKRQPRAKQATQVKQAAPAKRGAPVKQLAPVEQAAPGRGRRAAKKAAVAKATAPLKVVAGNQEDDSGQRKSHPRQGCQTGRPNQTSCANQTSQGQGDARRPGQGFGGQT